MCDRAERFVMLDTGYVNARFALLNTLHIETDTVSARRGITLESTSLEGERGAFGSQGESG